MSDATTHIRPGFICKMEREIRANARKGDWNEWQPEAWHGVAEIEHHFDKLKSALREQDPRRVSEYAADIANLCMKVDEVHGEK